MAQNNSRETSINKLSFEKAYARLEEMVRTLEQGGLNLQAATDLYEEGMRLARRCNELLSKTELRVSYIQTSYGEQMGLLGEQEEDAEG